MTTSNNHNSKQESIDPFWDANLCDIESDFLRKGDEITDLPTHTSNFVPPQGSVLLNNIYYSKKENPIKLYIRYFFNKVKKFRIC